MRDDYEQILADHRRRELDTEARARGFKDHNEYLQGKQALNKLLKWTIGPIAILIALLIWAKIAFEVQEIEAGQVGVVTDKPWIFGTGGVESDVLQPGRYTMWASKKVVSVPSVPLIQGETFNDLMTKDRTMLDFEASLELQVYDWPLMRKKFGPGWYAGNIERQFREMARREVKSRTMSEMLNDIRVSDEVDANLVAALTKHVQRTGLPVRIRGISLGRAKPDARVTEQMNETTAEQQRFITLQQQATNEEQRKQVEIKRAEADMAYRSTMKYTQEEGIQLKLAEIWADACKAGGNCVLTPPGTPVIAGAK